MQESTPNTNPNSVCVFIQMIGSGKRTRATSFANMKDAATGAMASGSTFTDHRVEEKPWPWQVEAFTLP